MGADAGDDPGAFGEPGVRGCRVDHGAGGRMPGAAAVLYEAWTAGHGRADGALDNLVTTRRCVDTLDFGISYIIGGPGGVSDEASPANRGKICDREREAPRG